MDEKIQAGVRGIYATEGAFLSDEQVVNLTNVLMSQCVSRNLPRTNIWRVIWRQGPYNSSPKREWLLYSIHRPRVDEIFDGSISFDPYEQSIEIEGPFDFFQAGILWPGKRIVFLPSEALEPSNMMPDQLHGGNWGEYLNACSQCGIIIGGKEEYACEMCQIGTCTNCHTELTGASSDDPEEEDFLLCETCDREFPIL